MPEVSAISRRGNVTRKIACDIAESANNWEGEFQICHDFAERQSHPIIDASHWIRIILRLTLYSSGTLQIFSYHRRRAALDLWILTWWALRICMSCDPFSAQSRASTSMRGLKRGKLTRSLQRPRNNNFLISTSQYDCLRQMRSYFRLHYPVSKVNEISVVTRREKSECCLSAVWHNRRIAIFRMIHKCFVYKLEFILTNLRNTSAVKMRAFVNFQVAPTWSSGLRRSPMPLATLLTVHRLKKHMSAWNGKYKTLELPLPMFPWMG